MVDRAAAYSASEMIAAARSWASMRCDRAALLGLGEELGRALLGLGGHPPGLLVGRAQDRRALRAQRAGQRRLVDDRVGRLLLGLGELARAGRAPGLRGGRARARPTRGRSRTSWGSTPPLRNVVNVARATSAEDEPRRRDQPAVVHAPRLRPAPPGTGPSAGASGAPAPPRRGARASRSAWARRRHADHREPGRRGGARDRHLHRRDQEDAGARALDRDGLLGHAPDVADGAVAGRSCRSRRSPRVTGERARAESRRSRLRVIARPADGPPMSRVSIVIVPGQRRRRRRLRARRRATRAVGPDPGAAGRAGARTDGRPRIDANVRARPRSGRPVRSMCAARDRERCTAPSRAHRRRAARTRRSRSSPLAPSSPTIAVGDGERRRCAPATGR